MRIGIDIRTIGKRGTGDESYTAQLVRELANMDEPPECILFTDDTEVPEYEWIRNLPGKMQTVVIPPANGVIWTFFRLPQYAQSYNLDLLHVHYITPLRFPRDIKLITTIHDVSWKIVPFTIPWKDRFLLNIFIPWSVRRADHVITVSEHSKYMIEQYFQVSSCKVHAIYNGGYVRSEDRSIGTDSYALPQTSVEQSYILHMSSLQPRKNVPQLIESYNFLRKKYIKEGKVDECPALVIAGGEGRNYDQNIDAMITYYHLENHIIRTGHVSEAEKYRLYAHATLFISLSLFEGFGIPFIESMSFGIPVVGSDRSCLPEIIGDGGETVSLENTGDIANRIFAICTDPHLYGHYAYNAFERAQEFTWESMASQTLEVYRQAVIEEE